MLCLPVVRSDEEHVTLLLTGLQDLTDCLVGCLNTLDGSLVNTGVANHIWWRKVVHHERILVLLDSLADLLSNASCAHLWRQIVSGDTLVGWDQILRLITLLKREHFLDTTVKEEGNVGVLLSLSDVDLLDTLCAESLGENVTHVLWLEGDGEWVVELVLGHGSECDILWIFEVWLWRTVDIAEELSNLSDTIRAVVEEEDLITILDTALSSTNNDWLQKLVVLVLGVALLDGSDWVAAVLTLAKNHTLHGNLDSVPTLVTVHCVVAANNCGNLSTSDLRGLLNKLLHVSSARLWIGITSITEEVDVDLWNTNVLGDLEKCVEVVLLGVLKLISNPKGLSVYAGLLTTPP